MEEVNALVKFHNDICRDEEALLAACVGGHASQVRLLVTKYGCDNLNARDVDGDTPLTCAGLSGNVECVELLINEFHYLIRTNPTVYKVG